LSSGFVSSREARDDATVTYTVSYRLQDLGISGVLVVMAESGLLTELRCQMQSCYCPGGRGYFDHTTSKENDWVPNPDHYPLSRANGGHLVPENVRLAHTRCNRLAAGSSPGHKRRRQEAQDRLAKWYADHGGKRAAEALWAEERQATQG
jgi:hypothetical protein